MRCAALGRCSGRAGLSRDRSPSRAGCESVAGAACSFGVVCSTAMDAVRYHGRPPDRSHLETGDTDGDLDRRLGPRSVRRCESGPQRRGGRGLARREASAVG